jgi:hypothetical protein
METNNIGSVKAHREAIPAVFQARIVADRFSVGATARGRNHLLAFCVAVHLFAFLLGVLPHIIYYYTRFAACQVEDQ